MIDASLAVSFMTVAELDRWAIRPGWGQQRRERLAEMVGRFTVIPADRDLCRTWAEVSEQTHRRGRPIQVADAWIAATALSLDVPLLTHNRGDVLGVDGLRLVAP